MSRVYDVAETLCKYTLNKMACFLIRAKTYPKTLAENKI